MNKLWVQVAIAFASTSFALSSVAQSSNGSGTIEPAVTGIGAQISLADKRFIAIHRQASDKNESSPLVYYFHRPLFIFQTASKVADGYPDIVVSPPRVINERTYLTFRIILTSKQFQEQARGFVIANDPSLQAPNTNLDLNRIRVVGWPIVTLNLNVVEPLTGHVLGTYTSPPLSAAPPIITIYVGFNNEDLIMFKQLAPIGAIDFAFSYSFENKRQQYAVSVANASREVNQALENSVSAANLPRDGPIFQSQVAQFRSELSTKLSTTISSSDTSLVPLVQSQLIDKYLPAQTVALQTLHDEKLSEAIYGYLRPLLKTAADKLTKSNSTTQSHEDTVQIGLKAEYFNVDKGAKDAISSTSAVTFEQDTTDQSYKPTSIKVYKLASITDQDTVQVVASAFISQGGDTTMLLDTPVPSDFTDKEVSGFKAGEHISNFDAVLPGMAFCYFGDQIPAGYFEVDGVKTWPDAAWVPTSLRGKKTSDAQDMLIGVTRRPPEIGTVWNEGRIPLGDISIPANGLNLTFKGDWNHLTVNDIPQRGGNHLPDIFIPSVGDSIYITSYGLSPEHVADQITGSVTLHQAPIPLNNISTDPQHVRCRLIVKQ